MVKKLHSGYGEGAPSGRGPDQGAISPQGKEYLDKNFPNLDSIKSATIQAAAGQVARHSITRAGMLGGGVALSGTGNLACAPDEQQPQ